MAKKPESDSPTEAKKLNNLRIWDALAKTDKNYTKSFNRRGFRGTDINPAYRILRLTRIFGPAGEGWGYEIVNRWREDFEEGPTVFVELVLWFVDPATGTRVDLPPSIGGTVATRTPDESYKMSITDALGKAAALIGLGADVYLGEFDGKYQRPVEPPKATRPPISAEDLPLYTKILGAILSPGVTVDQLERFGPRIDEHVSNTKLSEDEGCDLHAELNKRIAQLSPQPVTAD